MAEPNSIKQHNLLDAIQASSMNSVMMKFICQSIPLEDADVHAESNDFGAEEEEQEGSMLSCWASDTFHLDAAATITCY